MAVSYNRNQFELCPTNILSVDPITTDTTTQMKAECKVYHLVSQIIQLANVRIARLRDVQAAKLAEAAIPLNLRFCDNSQICLLFSRI